MPIVVKPNRTNKITDQPRKQVVQMAETFEDLPHPSQQISNLWMVKNSSGPWYRRHKEGFYRSHGVGWQYEGKKFDGRVIIK